MMRTSYADWHRTFSLTQKYLHSRLSGGECGRDQVAAWRWFYQTYDPLIKSQIRRILPADCDVTEHAEEIWCELLVQLPKLTRPVNADSLQLWMIELIRSTLARNKRPTSKEAPGSLPMPESNDPAHVPASMNDRIYQLRVIDVQPLPRVARALGLTSHQVADRQREMLKKILSILINFDAQSRPI